MRIFSSERGGNRVRAGIRGKLRRVRVQRAAEHGVRHRRPTPSCHMPVAVPFAVGVLALALVFDIERRDGLSLSPLALRSVSVSTVGPWPVATSHVNFTLSLVRCINSQVSDKRTTKRLHTHAHEAHDGVTHETRLKGQKHRDDAQRQQPGPDRTTRRERNAHQKHRETIPAVRAPHKP